MKNNIFTKLTYLKIVLGVYIFLITPILSNANDDSTKKTQEDTGYRFYIGGNVGVPSLLGGSVTEMATNFGEYKFSRTNQTNGAYGSGYLGVETDSGLSFELGAIQIANKRSTYSSDLYGGSSFTARMNMTVPYFGIGYRIPFYVPELLDNSYTQFLKNISFKPFAGLGVGISNTMFTPDQDLAYITDSGRQINATVLPYFKIDAQYQFSEHWYVGGNIGFLLNTRYTQMKSSSIYDDKTINIPGYNVSSTLLTGVSIEYMF